MKPNKRWITGIVALFVVLGAGATVMFRWTRVDRAAADKIALGELDGYAARERLARPSFSAAEVTEHDGMWLYNYRYEGEPKHEVAIIVHRNGRAELSRMRDDASP